MNVGIDALSFYTSPFYLTIDALAIARGYRSGSAIKKTIGQESMSVLPPDEDVVTMGANAAAMLRAEPGFGEIELLVFATESAFDMAKAGGIYLRRLLGLPNECRTFEVKQACYGGTAALQMALDWVRQNPDKKALVVASDNARYELNTSAEWTQGCGAVAMLLSANPRILALNGHSGYYTEDVMDFWHPNYTDGALVDGAFSKEMYLRSLGEAWRAYRRKNSLGYADHAAFCYHCPFVKMVEMAHKQMAQDYTADPANGEDPWRNRLGEALKYGSRVGNSYAASLYVSLASLLDNSAAPLDGQRIGLYSYGSGCMAEFFSGTVVDGYRSYLGAEARRTLFADQKEISCDEYEQFFNYPFPKDGGEHEFPAITTGTHRLAGVKGHSRIYG